MVVNEHRLTRYAHTLRDPARDEHGGQGGDPCVYQGHVWIELCLHVAADGLQNGLQYLISVPACCSSHAAIRQTIGRRGFALFQMGRRLLRQRQSKPVEAVCCLWRDGA
eukprot:1511501-Prymnesium_polylepis.1